MTPTQHAILKRITAKKAALDALRPLPQALDKNLYEWFRIALTYSSNAIEGNTLSLAETAQVVEKQLTISGKSITEHLEAVNHAQAVDFIRDLATSKTREQLTLADILAIHAIIFKAINYELAGLRTVATRITGSTIACPNYAKVPELMDELITYVTNSQDHIATIAAQAHLQLVGIHPFVDDNRRTARLLMNLLLLQSGYPITIIDVKDRAAYIAAIQKALQGNATDYYNLVYAAIQHSLDEYLTAAHDSKL